MPASAMFPAPDAPRKSRKLQAPDAPHNVDMAACPLTMPCLRPLHPKLAQRSYLPSFVQNAAATLLGGSTLDDPTSAWDLREGTTRTITIGTTCSGSELYMLSVPLLAKALSDLTRCQVSFEHVWACELNNKKQDWIATHFRPQFLFSDVKQVADASLPGRLVPDILTGRLVPVPAVDILISGFSCKDASRLNIHHRDRLDAVDKGAFSTGGTFRAFIRPGQQLVSVVLLLLFVSMFWLLCFVVVVVVAVVAFDLVVVLVFVVILVVIAMCLVIVVVVVLEVVLLLMLLLLLLC